MPAASTAHDDGPVVRAVMVRVAVLQERQHLRGRHILGDEGLADAARQDEGQRAARHLLVLGDDSRAALGVGQLARNVGHAARQADGAEMRLDPRRVVGAGKVEPRRKAMRQRHADRDRLAMHQPGAVVAGRRFQRMAEGVAEIEQRAVAGLELVAGDDIGLGAAGFGDRLRPAPAPPANTSPPVPLQPGEEFRPVDQPVFGDLGIAGAEFARRQRVERVGVGQHQPRLVEDADQVLAVRGC